MVPIAVWLVPMSVALLPTKIPWSLIAVALSAISPSFEVMLFVLASISSSFEVNVTIARLVIVSYVCWLVPIQIP